MQRIGRYEVVRPLGQGAAGEVFEVRAPDGGPPLALKLLTASSDEAVTRFAREGSLLQFLSRHPRIVKIRDMGEERGRPWLVMDLVRGGTLLQRLSRSSDARDIFPLLLDVARALHFAHEAGVVHRDVKPSNILIDDAGRAVLSDFGIARDVRAERLTKTGAIIGTPQYISPEQVDAEKPVDRRADVYALGAILYRALTGVPPFDGAEASLWTRILLEEPERPSKLAPGIDPRLEALTLAALAKDPARRPQTAEDFARALEEALAPPRSARPRPAMFAAAAGAAIVIGAACFVAGSLRSRERITEPPVAVERPAEKPAPPSPRAEAETLAAAHASAGRNAEAVREWLRAAKLARDEGGAARAAPLVEKAYEVDPSLTAHEGGRDAAVVLQSAALAALRGAPDAATVALARRRAIRARLLDTKLPLRDVAELVWKLGSSPDPAIRRAARPWRLASASAGLEAALRATSPAGIEPRLKETWPDAWRAYIGELNPQQSAESFEATSEWLLWQPELTFIWTWSGTSARSAGRPREAIRMFESARSLDRTDRGIAEDEFQWGVTLIWTDPAAAVPHLEQAIASLDRTAPGTVWDWPELDLAFALIESGKPQEGLVHLAKLEELPINGHSYPTWAKILAFEALGRHEAADSLRPSLLQKLPR
jgi:tetratricopeptide (TPR) repeat protein